MNIETFPRDALGTALANRVATDLRAALAAQGRASLAVPGGSTPGPFLKALAAEDLDWAKITVAPTDERQVPADNDRSNAKLIRETLLTGAAQAARLVPLYGEGIDAASVAEAILPLDVCVLGMGGDMHTASLFPGTPGLAALLDPNGISDLAFVSPPGADEDRVTLTVRALTTAPHIYVLITGTDKRAALATAMETDDPAAAPIRAILDAVPSTTIFYAD